MYGVFRLLIFVIETVIKSWHWLVRAIMRALETYTQLPRLLRIVITPIAVYLTFAIVLVYVFAPIRGMTGKMWHEGEFQYASERWLATALYDSSGAFVGTFDPRLDSKRDVNFTGRPIELSQENYVASPDHKSIPTKDVPEYYWSCLKYQEDRYLGGILNPFGIDLAGVLKIPYSMVERSIAGGGIKLGVGGSTLSMQLVRAFFKLTPHSGEGVGGKLSRKFVEWWYAPVVYNVLTPGGDLEPFKLWTANHLPLAQRTGGQPLYGVEQTARVIFGKTAKELSIAEQFVLAAAVNHPIILLEGSERLNKVRIDAWRRITKGRAHSCAVALLGSDSEKISVITELDDLGNGPPDPKVAPAIAKTLKHFAPDYARWAEANPVIRANLLAPAARYGARREMENIFGYGWRKYVRGVDLTLDLKQNLAFRRKVQDALPGIEEKYKKDIGASYSLDVRAVRQHGGIEKSVPDIVVAAANEKGEIVRYYESRDTASYFGSWGAIDRGTGHYVPERESRAIASVGKMLAAIAISNQGRDNLDTIYVDTAAPESGLESCRRNGGLRRGRRAETAFACSLSNPLERRLARIGQRTSQKLVDAFGFTMPPPDAAGIGTPPSTAIVRGFIAGSPRKVHQMAGVVLAALTGRAGQKIPPPSLVRHFDYGATSDLHDSKEGTTDAIIPKKVIRSSAHKMLRAFLSAPLCYESHGRRFGTLSSISGWCSNRRKDVRLHFAKTGTQVTLDPDAIIDVWVAGGIQFANGKSFSYVVLVGTGNTSQPWARRVHSAQIGAPLADLLLKDLRTLAYSPVKRQSAQKVSQSSKK